jgi:hypothetical protein
MKKEKLIHATISKLLESNLTIIIRDKSLLLEVCSDVKFMKILYVSLKTWKKEFSLDLRRFSTAHYYFNQR